MSIAIDRYLTSKFILKDDDAVLYIKNLIDLFEDQSNLAMGYGLSDSYNVELISYGNKTFRVAADGLADSGLELRYSSVNEVSKDDEEDYHDPICLFSEIQKRLQENTWFFVENHCIEKCYFSSYVSFYHQDGRVEHKGSHDLKVDILKLLNIQEKVE